MKTTIVLLNKCLIARRIAGSLWVLSFLLALVAVAVSGCGGGKPTQQSKDFFTSGSREADQRASQRMAQAEQLSGSGEGAGEKGAKESGGTNNAATSEEKRSLFERLGGEAGISNIVADFLPRAMQDPRVNWDRKGVKQGGLSFHSGRLVTWNPTPAQAALLQTHMVQFLALASGGPAHYDGKEIQSTHADMHISNAEFDATLGDLKSSLDALRVPNKEQKELLAIVESTRPLIVTDR